jgi:hypothetical protein
MRNCPVFYRPEMSANTESFSTSSSKPKRTVTRQDSWGQARAAIAKATEVQP